MTILYMDGFDALPEKDLYTKGLEALREAEARPQPPTHNEDGKYIVHNVPQAAIDHLPADIKELIDARPIQLLDERPSKMIFFSNPGPRDDFTWRYLRAHMELNSFAIGNGDRTLYGEFPHPEPRYPDYPTFTWKEIYPRDTWHRLNGYHGEAKTPGERWFESGFSLKYYGFQSPALWDHYEWLGDESIHHTERFSPTERWHRGILRVKVPARRYSGLNAYELSTLEYLKQPKPVDCAWWIFRFVTSTYYYQEKEEWTHSLIQAGLDEAFKVVKKPIKQRMSARPRLK